MLSDGRADALIKARLRVRSTIVGAPSKHGA
jgi:hypothetical protein